MPALLIVVATEAERPAVGAESVVEILVCGIGKTAAAAATALRLVQGGVGAVVSFGVAGAYPAGGLAIGDVVVGTEAAVVDEGLESGGAFVPFSSPGMHVPAATWMCSDAALVDRLVSGPPHAFRVEAGRIATVSVCAGTQRLADGRGRTALAEGAEGGAVAHVCGLVGVPFAEVRGISNPCGLRDAAPFDLGLAVAHAGEVLSRLVP